MAACEAVVMNGAQRRRINQTVRQAVALEILRGGDAGWRALDEELLGTERVVQRWVISVGSGQKVEQWDETPASRLPPLDDATAIIVDQIMCRAPERVRRLVLPWYRGTGSTTTLQQKLGLDRAGLYMEWRAVMFYLKRCFEDTQYPDLVKLLDVRL